MQVRDHHIILENSYNWRLIVQVCDHHSRVLMVESLVSPWQPMSHSQTMALLDLGMRPLLAISHGADTQ